MLAWTVGGVWLLVVPLLPYSSLVDPGYRAADFGPLIDSLRARAAGERLLLVDNQWVAGNLAYLAPDLSPHLLRPGEVPVFWACGVTSQAALEAAGIPFFIAHAPGCMLITDLRHPGR